MKDKFHIVLHYWLNGGSPIWFASVFFRRGQTGSCLYVSDDHPSAAAAIAEVSKSLNSGSPA